MPTLYGQVGRGAALLVLAVALAGCVLASLAYGAAAIPIGTVINSFTDYDGTVSDHLVIRELRVPRTIVGVMVGSALGLAGALMQGITRNPIADPGILGVNAGASFTVVLGIWIFGVTSVGGLVWFALFGAAATSVIVYALGSMGRGGATPVRLALAGAALSALLFALTRAVTLLDQATLDQFRFWSVGSLAGRDASTARDLAVFIIAGALISFGLARPLNAIGLGEDSARALGVKIGRTRAFAGLAIMLLCGAAVAAVGPVGFVGLIVPHMMRFLFGPDQRWLLPACALFGPALLLACDTLGRVIDRPSEVQVGIMTAAIGGPAFVILARHLRTVPNQ